MDKQTKDYAPWISLVSLILAMLFTIDLQYFRPPWISPGFFVVPIVLAPILAWIVAETRSSAIKHLIISSMAVPFVVIALGLLTVYEQHNYSSLIHQKAWQVIGLAIGGWLISALIGVSVGSLIRNLSRGRKWPTH
jgi:hypothetical protein